MSRKKAGDAHPTLLSCMHWSYWLTRSVTTTEDGPVETTACAACARDVLPARAIRAVDSARIAAALQTPAARAPTVSEAPSPAAAQAPAVTPTREAPAEKPTSPPRPRRRRKAPAATQAQLTLGIAAA